MCNLIERRWQFDDEGPTEVQLEELAEALKEEQREADCDRHIGWRRRPKPVGFTAGRDMPNNTEEDA